jgi:two-component system cell cycle sensor histidine kinase/response regulator CckA
MLYQQLPSIESAPLGASERWLAPALGVAAGLSVALVLAVAGQPLLAGAAAVAGLVGAAVAYRRLPVVTPPGEALVAGPDYALLGSALGLSRDPVALTTGEGSLLVVNQTYRERFGVHRPLDLAADEHAAEGLRLAQTMAWRDGAGCVTGIATSSGTSPVEVERVGSSGDLLLWRFPDPPAADPLAIAVKRIEGATGERLSAAGVLAAVVDSTGTILAANRAFAERTLGSQQPPGGSRFRDLVEVGEDERMRLVSEGESAQALRGVHVPAEPNADSGAGTFLLFDRAGSSEAEGSNLQSLLDVLPIGLALVDRDGRFLTMNQAFRQAAGLTGTSTPVYPGDLVVKEDKAAVADAVRRNTRGPAMSGDLAVRLARQPSEPVALTIAGLRGLGEAAVLLLLKDNS